MGVETKGEPHSTPALSPSNKQSLAGRMSDQECERWLTEAKKDHLLYASVPPSVLVYLVRNNPSGASTTAPAAPNVKYNQTLTYRNIVAQLEEAARRSR